MSDTLRNIALLAHVDAGKTSLTEQLLFISGQIRKAGNVDDGTTQSDYQAIEKQRGISVFSSHCSFQWKGNTIHLIDTPGHIDFIADVQRIIPAIDGAVLILSAVEGIQSQTLLHWNVLKERNIPTLIFINKIDRTGSNLEEILHQLKREFGIHALSMQSIDSESLTITSEWGENHLRTSIAEAIATEDIELMNDFFENRINYKLFHSSLKKQVKERRQIPVFFGSSKESIGIQELADAMLEYLPAPENRNDEPFEGVVIGKSFDKIFGKMTHLRILSGKLENRASLYIENQEQKITAIRLLKQGKTEEKTSAYSGEVVAIGGLSNLSIGDIIGTQRRFSEQSKAFPKALISVQVTPIEEKNRILLGEALTLLNEEIPSLEFEWNKETHEYQIKTMGNIQTEVIQSLIKERNGILCQMEKPSVIYKETPSEKGIGYIRYWMPKPCWAILKFLIEPGERGSGVEYESKVGVNEIAQKYQNEIEKSIIPSLKQGIKGWEVCDLKITLIEGEDHEVHSRPGDFAVATPMGIMDGLQQCGTDLLEPILRFKIRAEEKFLGGISSDIQKMRGRFESPIMSEGFFEMHGNLPLSTSMDYATVFTSKTSGKGLYYTEFFSYEKCSLSEGKIRPYQGISPLDQAKWILKARGAIQ